MRKMLANEPLNDNDTRIVNDDLYYTLTGAMKKMNAGRNKVLALVNNGDIEVFFHPTLGWLFSESAIADWVRNLTHKVPRKKK